jgi:prepilin-type N-terminal cleavage/methylation domain-containing protein
MEHRAFTLVELLVVLVILCLVATSVQFVVKRPLGLARQRMAIDQFCAADALVRNICRTNRREGRFEFDVVNQSYTWRLGQNASESRVTSIPGLMNIRSPRGHHSSWTTQVDRWGRTDSFAIFIGSDKSHGKWLLCSGVSGQIIEFDNESEIENILNKLTASDFAH